MLKTNNRGNPKGLRIRVNNWEADLNKWEEIEFIDGYLIKNSGKYKYMFNFAHDNLDFEIVLSRKVLKGMIDEIDREEDVRSLVNGL